MINENKINKIKIILRFIVCLLLVTTTSFFIVEKALEAEDSDQSKPESIHLFWSSNNNTYKYAKNPIVNFTHEGIGTDKKQKGERKGETLEVDNNGLYTIKGSQDSAFPIGDAKNPYICLYFIDNDKNIIQNLSCTNDKRESDNSTCSIVEGVDFPILCFDKKVFEKEEKFFMNFKLNNKVRNLLISRVGTDKFKIENASRSPETQPTTTPTTQPASGTGGDKGETPPTTPKVQATTDGGPVAPVILSQEVVKSLNESWGISMLIKNITYLIIGMILCMLIAIVLIIIILIEVFSVQSNYKNIEIKLNETGKLPDEMSKNYKNINALIFNKSNEITNEVTNNTSMLGERYSSIKDTLDILKGAVETIVSKLLTKDQGENEVAASKTEKERDELANKLKIKGTTEIVEFVNSLNPLLKEIEIIKEDFLKSQQNKEFNNTEKKLNNSFIDKLEDTCHRFSTIKERGDLNTIDNADENSIASRLRNLRDQHLYEALDTAFKLREFLKYPKLTQLEKENPGLVSEYTKSVDRLFSSIKDFLDKHDLELMDIKLYDTRFDTAKHDPTTEKDKNHDYDNNVITKVISVGLIKKSTGKVIREAKVRVNKLD